MRKFGYLILFIGICNIAFSQKTIVKQATVDSISPKIDSSLNEEINTSLLENIPVVAIDDNDLNDLSTQNISSSLSAGRDPFINAASFNFFIARFRPRGYNQNNSTTFMNGAKLENLDNGGSNFGAFSGLAGVLRNRHITNGIRPNTFGYGGIGFNTEIDTRPSTQRKRTEFGYSISNGNYTHRWSFTHCTGVNKNGWAFTISGTRRWADEGYVPGTYINSWSYFVGVDKKFGQKRTVSLVVFNTPTERGGQRTSVYEMDTLVGSHYYNSAWGYQNGKKRNASVTRTNQPYIILSDETKFNNSSSLVNTASISFGTRGFTGLEFFNAPNPAPDFYRYLPSYYTKYPMVASIIAQQIRTDVNKRQIDWQGFYDANRSHKETIENATVNGVPGQTFTGLQSNYILGERVVYTQRANFSSTFNKRFKRVEFTTGILILTQNDHNYRQVNDLLGGTFYLDLNQFAYGTSPSNPLRLYPDLNKPNNIIKAGDKYGYNYNAHINKEQFWSQGIFKFKRLDLFAAGEISSTQFWRVGNIATGLYPKNSLGKSKVYSFTNFGIKGGATYKLDGKNYFFVNASYETKAPDFRNVFLAPSSRDQVQDNIKNEKATSVEAGYLFNGPTLKLRATGYYTRTKDEMRVQGFFNDDYLTFTNYATNNIAKVHFGSEIGFEAKVIPVVTVTGAASIGRFYFDSRQNAITVNDNTQGILARDIVYSQNYRVPNTPQEAYSLGIQYRSRNYWYIGLNGNYFDQIWGSVNPLHLTRTAVSNVLPTDTATYFKIINQDRLLGQFTMDLNAGCSWRLPRQWLHKSFSLFMLNGRISNLLNNKELVTFGGQQLRFDKDNLGKFPPRYTYANGLTFALNATLRF